MHKGLGIFLGTAALAFAIASAEAKTQLRVVVAYYSAATQGIFEGMAKDFSTAHPDADVKVEVVQWDNLEQRLTTDSQLGCDRTLPVNRNSSCLRDRTDLFPGQAPFPPVPPGYPNAFAGGFSFGNLQTDGKVGSSRSTLGVSPCLHRFQSGVCHMDASSVLRYDSERA